MEAQEVIKLYNLLEQNSVKIWLDGGWGVDALLGKQTRPHADVDIVVQNKDVDKLKELLANIGYGIRAEERWWNFILADKHGHEIDVHTITFDEKMNGTYGPQEDPLTRSEPYPAASLHGEGTISGHKVRCLTADYQVVSHTGYELDDNDFKDVYALHEKFGVPLPDEYKK